MMWPVSSASSSSFPIDTMPKIILRQHQHDNGWVSSARYSPCEIYRYTLQRVWEPEKPLVSFIGLNPSTATEVENDPTVRRCIGYALAWGYGGMRMLNAFGLRSTDPRGLKQIDDPVGPENDRWLRDMTKDVALTVACWGVHAEWNGRHQQILKLMRTANRTIHCLGVTLAGYPKHPLYLKSSLQPTEFPLH